MAHRQNEDTIELVELPLPTLIDSHKWSPSPTPVQLTAEQYVSVYDDKQWEEFILEYATTFRSYEKVMRNGGGNDHGVDVAAFLTSNGFDGAWDCFQCKHYLASLKPSEAYPEIVKIILGVMEQRYTWPNKYRFVAPKGYSTTLAQKLNSPTNLKETMIKELTKKESTLAKKLGPHSVADVVTFIRNSDFTIFGSIELHELVKAHKSTRWHSARFGVSLPLREDPDIPELSESEKGQRYISQLLQVYEERYKESFTLLSATENSRVSRHFLRHRVAFYTAESLRLFARESVPSNTFADLQEEIYDGVIDIHDEFQGDGISRITTITKAAHDLSLTSNELLPSVTIRDRTGICQQLVNDSRLSWCDATSE